MSLLIGHAEVPRLVKGHRITATHVLSMLCPLSFFCGLIDARPSRSIVLSLASRREHRGPISRLWPRLVFLSIMPIPIA